jgi:hypothetical protein
MATPDMTVKLYIFPLTKEEASKPHITGLKLIRNNENRLVEVDEMGANDFNLNNYDKGRNLIVYNDVVYEIFKDYSDVSNHARYFMLKPLLTGCEQM